MWVCPLQLHIVLKRSARGVVLGTCFVRPGQPKVTPMFRVLEAAPLPAGSAIVNTSGAGDTLVGASLAQLVANSPASKAKPGSAGTVVADTQIDSMLLALRVGLRAAAYKIVQPASVSPKITPQSVQLTFK